MLGLSKREKLADAIRRRRWTEASVLLCKIGNVEASLFASVVVQAPLSLIEMCIEEGADLGGVSDTIVEPPLNVAARADRADAVALLLSKGAEVNRTDGTGVTPLMAAAYLGHENTVRTLLRHSAALELGDREGFTALMWAANAGATECVTLLLAVGANPNARDHGNSTPIMFASQHGHLNSVIALVAAGADTHAKGDLDLDARGFAAKNGQAVVVAWLDAWEVGPRPFEPRSFTSRP